LFHSLTSSWVGGCLFWPSLGMGINSPKAFTRSWGNRSVTVRETTIL
jgi:hypothetical protein